MSPYGPPLGAIEEVRQLNRLFLGFLREQPEIATEHFGLSRAASDLLRGSTADQIDCAADFPRALFRLHLPSAEPAAVMDPLGLTRESGRRILQVTLLHSAWSLCRSSGYSARLLLRLSDDEVRCLRQSDVNGILLMSHGDDVVRAAFDEFDWIWPKLLTESRPEQRRRLLLIGMQPDFSPLPSAGLA